MSLARRALLVASRSKPVFTTQTRAASSSSHDHHEDAHHEDSTVYPAETFGTALWRNVLLASVAGVAIFKYAPVADENVYLTRWIAMYKTPRDYWLSLNATHTVQAEEIAQGTILMNDASTPAIHRFTYPQSMLQASPFMNGVGLSVDMSGVVPKTGYEHV
ncbi:hypothetical protein BDZ97DRAFT_1649328 [Flammula alnicola]|nr:hypothetical protein BDZ97DRAFT_1649328 [Flammula alnicola]